LASIVFDESSAVPLYQQIYVGIREHIIAGSLTAGSKLASSRRMAIELGVSRFTIVAAFDALLSEGYLVASSRGGTFVSKSLPDLSLRSRTRSIPRGDSRRAPPRFTSNHLPGIAMATIRQQDLIQSIEDSLQYISYYHPVDYITALGEAYAAEQSPAAKDAIAQILTNSRMCAEGHRPICQDTGIIVAFVKVGMDVRWEGVTMSIAEMVDEGVRRAYLHPDNTLRASILHDPAGKRRNSKDNTPAVVHFDIVPGGTVEVKIAAKGGGSENKSKFTMLNPSDSIVDWVVKTVPTMGAGWCPPGMLGIGIGGTAEKAMVLAKESLMDPIDLHELRQRGPSNRLEELRLEIYDKAGREAGSVTPVSK